MFSENADELWDLYTKDREKTGLVHRRGDVMPAGQYRLAVHVCIFNSKNQLLIQQRQPYKKGWPNMWDVSVGGSATAGDTSAMAAQREVLEELGLELDLSDARPFLTMNFSKGFDDFYIIEQDVDLSGLHLQESEVKQVRWADREEVIRLQEQGIMIPYWFLDRLFEIRHSHKAHGGRLHEVKVMAARAEHTASWMSLAEILKQEMAADDETSKDSRPFPVRNADTQPDRETETSKDSRPFPYGDADTQPHKETETNKDSRPFPYGDTDTQPLGETEAADTRLDLEGRRKADWPENEPDRWLEEYRKEVLMHIIQGSAVCAVDGHMVVGFLLYAPDEDKPSSIAVHPEYRGQGIAARMMQLMEREENGERV